MVIMGSNDIRNIELMSAGLNLIGQAISIYDLDLRLRVSNVRFQKMFNLPRNLVTPGASFEHTIRYLVEIGEYGPVENKDDFVADKVRQALAFEPHYFERVRASGRSISVEGSPLPQGGWVAVYTDITAGKRAEALLRARSDLLSDQLLTHAADLAAANRELAATITALEETKRALTESEARSRLTAEMMPAHIAHLDASGRYTYSNRRLSNVLPGRPSDIVGLRMEDALGPYAYERIAPNLSKAYNGESTVFEFTEDVDSRRVRVVFTPDDSGGVYIMSMDITEETQARVALQQTQRRSVAAQVTSGLAHDFSNLLTIILGLQSRLEAMALSDDAAELVTATQKVARRGGRLLNRLADMTSARPPQLHPTDLHALLQDLKILSTPSLPRDVGLTIVDTTPDGLVLIDPGPMQDALLNLILNARDACGSHGQITISAHVAGDTWIEIVVSDTGSGFTETTLEQALDPFFTTKGRDGSGLGLPMVYDTVKRSGGDLRLSNDPTGARVTLRVPYRPAQVTSGGVALLVEDDLDVRRDIRNMLLSLGHPVIETAVADEATKLVSEVADIALVVSDVGLEGDKTGLDLYRSIARPELPFILMTALPLSDPLHQQARSLVPVLQKPFRKSDLASLIGQEQSA